MYLVLLHIIDLLSFSINNAAAPLHHCVFCGGPNFGFLLLLKFNMLFMAKHRIFRQWLVGLASLSDWPQVTQWMNSTSLGTRENIYITAEPLPDCAQVRDPMVLGRNLKCSGLQLWSLSRQLQCLAHFQIPSPAAFCCYLCANIGQQNCWIGMCSSAWGTSVQILAVYPNPALISFAHETRLQCWLFGER